MSDIKQQAEKEYQEEVFREAVEKEKARLRKKKTLLEMIFPWEVSVTIKRRNHESV